MKKLSCLVVFHILCSLLVPLVAAEEAGKEKEGSGSPFDSLPAGVKPTEGKVTLYADFGGQGAATVYLMNASEKRIRFSWNATLEVQSIDGVWSGVPEPRSPPGMFVCGTNPDVWISPGRYLKFPISYEPGLELMHGRIVYRGGVDGNLVSNEDLLTVFLDAQRYDAQAMKDGPFEDVAAVATGRVEGRG